MDEFSTLVQVILIDLLFAGDNAIAIGLVAKGLPKSQRKKVIAWGVVLAVILRIAFAVVTVQLLKIPGLLIVGGLLLLWVCWRLWQDFRQLDGHATDASMPTDQPQQSVSFRQALIRIVAADVSMSLDNVLAVAGVAREHLIILVFGLALSVVLMLVAATLIADILSRYKWIAYVGLFIILFVALTMLWDGGHDIAQRFFV